MDIRKLPGTEISATCLGFGCANLMRLSSRRERLNLLAAAYDAGIRYFDVARMYGLGYAEKELGLFLKGKREEVIIATKFGISPSSSTRAAGFLQPMARKLLAAFPAIKKKVAKKAGKLYQEKTYTVENGRKSLSASLAQLGTDYVDLLFLHEPTLETITDPDLQPWLESLKKEGVIRAYGVAGHINTNLPVISKYPSLAPVIQIDNDAVGCQLKELENYESQAIITFSPIIRVLATIQRFLDSDRVVLERWSQDTNHDFKQPDTLARFLFAYALASNPKGIVLFSTTKPDRVLKMVRWLEDNAVGPDALAAFLDLLKDADLNGVQHE